MSIETDNLHYARVERFAKEIQNLYFDVAGYCAMLTTNHSFESGIFAFKDYPVLNRMVDKIIDNMRKSMYTTIQSGISQEWEMSNENNDELVKQLSRNIKLPSGKYQTRNLKALEAFQNRKVGGLRLSDRVWNYTNQFKGEIEQALDVGIADGRSAAQLSRDIREYLREPEKLFRRVRDKNGILRPSKNALKYNPGAGVYRSSYKNAMRLTRTEINTSYREADFLRWQQMDFVVGIEVRRSNNEYNCDVCESLKGRYPKNFKFSGWHVSCRCHAISILATEKELLESIENDTPINSKNEMKNMPENFNQWMDDNSQRIQRAKSLPYFIDDNKKVINLPPRNVEELMSRAEQSSKEMKSFAGRIAKQFNGYSVPVNLKKEERIIEKVNSELNGNIAGIKDAIRTTIILSEKNMQSFLRNSNKFPNFIRVKNQTPDKYQGYSGILTNIRTKNGTVGEIQFNTEKMIYAKETPEIAKKLIGEARWNEIKTETGMSGGLGHKYYEQWRKLKIQKNLKGMEEVEKLSLEYYNHFR